MPSLQQNVESVAGYYAARAPEYDRGSGIGTVAFEETFGRLKALYQSSMADRTVLEIACGTGYWTEALAQSARAVLATDVNAEVIDLSKKKLRNVRNVRFEVADAYSLNLPERFSAGFAHFWLSHVPKKRLKSFVTSFHHQLEPGALVILADSMPYEADWAKRRIDEHGDIYEERILMDGRRFETIKNFPTAADIADLLRGQATDVVYSEHQRENVWTVFYRVRH